VTLLLAENFDTPEALVNAITEAANDGNMVVVKLASQHSLAFREPQASDLQTVGDELLRLHMLCQSARHLLLAATGKEDGPTSWVETRDRWLKTFDGTREQGVKNED
jgi:hypothetical protein